MPASAMQAPDAEEADVGRDALVAADRLGADRDHRARVERAAEQDDIRASRSASAAATSGLCVTKVAAGGRPASASAVVPPSTIATSPGSEQRGRGAGHGLLAGDGLGRALGVGRGHGRARHRAAVDAAQRARLGELLEVAAHGVAGDAEPVREVGGDHAALWRRRSTIRRWRSSFSTRGQTSSRRPSASTPRGQTLEPRPLQQHDRLAVGDLARPDHRERLGEPGARAPRCPRLRRPRARRRRRRGRRGCTSRRRSAIRSVTRARAHEDVEQLLDVADAHAGLLLGLAADRGLGVVARRAARPAPRSASRRGGR